MDEDDTPSLMPLGMSEMGQSSWGLFMNEATPFLVLMKKDPSNVVR